MPHGGTNATESFASERTISFDAGKLRTGLEVIANQLGKKLDEDNPYCTRNSRMGADLRR